VGIEDEAWSGAAGSPFGGGTPLHDRLEDLGDAGAVLRGGEDHLLARDREDVLQLLHHHLGLGRRQVDLVDDRDDRQASRSARWTFASVCASIPWAASTTRIAPSHAWRLRLTS
jgi:hypothetical protein